MCIRDRREDILDAPYFHVVFTVPEELNPCLLHTSILFSVNLPNLSEYTVFPSNTLFQAFHTLRSEAVQAFFPVLLSVFSVSYTHLENMKKTKTKHLS